MNLYGLCYFNCYYIFVFRITLPWKSTFQSYSKTNRSPASQINGLLLILVLYKVLPTWWPMYPLLDLPQLYVYFIVYCFGKRIWFSVLNMWIAFLYNTKSLPTWWPRFPLLELPQLYLYLLSIALQRSHSTECNMWCWLVFV